MLNMLKSRKQRAAEAQARELVLDVTKALDDFPAPIEPATAVAGPSPDGQNLLIGATLASGEVIAFAVPLDTADVFAGMVNTSLEVAKDRREAIMRLARAV